MELRHLRYFVAVADASSVNVAATQSLHTSQPSLSRQIRSLEEEVGAQLLTRSAHGVELTAAGRVLLDQARLILLQVESAVAATRRAAQPIAKPRFALGFLTGHEVTFLPEVLRLFRDELPNIELLISSDVSPKMAEAVAAGHIDAALIRREHGEPGLNFVTLITEPLQVFMPRDHRLSRLKSINPMDLAGETFLGMSTTAPVLRTILDAYFKDCGLNITSSHDIDHLGMAMSLIASTRGVTLLPAYANNFLPSSVTSRPLKGKIPTIDLVVAYKKTNHSPTLRLFLSRLDGLAARVTKKT